MVVSTRHSVDGTYSYLFTTNEASVVEVRNNPDDAIVDAGLDAEDAKAIRELFATRSAAEEQCEVKRQVVKFLEAQRETELQAVRDKWKPLLEPAQRDEGESQKTLQKARNGITSLLYRVITGRKRK